MDQNTSRLRGRAYLSSVMPHAREGNCPMRRVAFVLKIVGVVLCLTITACKTKAIEVSTKSCTETVLLPGNVEMVLVWIPEGTFTMGCPDTELDSASDVEAAARDTRNGGGSEENMSLHGLPRHTVRLNGFWMGKYELTKRQWQAVMGTTPWAGDRFVLADLESPAVDVSWDDAQLFLKSLRGYTNQRFRLPSEAEWEYACRAGTSTRFYWGDDPNYEAIDHYAWSDAYAVDGPYEKYAKVVGLRLPNAWGLYDMSGNVSEWCEDDWHGNYVGAPTEGKAWVDTPRRPYRVLRGGSWTYEKKQCRSANRYTPWMANVGNSDYGFRVVLTP